MLTPPLHAPPTAAAPPGAPAGGIAGMLRQLAARHAMQRGHAGPGARQAGGPYPLTARGNPVSPYGHTPATPPVPNMQRPMPPVGM